MSILSQCYMPNKYYNDERQHISFAVHRLTEVTRSSALSCGHLVTRREGLLKRGVMEERSASAGAHHPIGRGTYSPRAALLFLSARFVSSLFHACAPSPTLPWGSHLVPRLKSIIKTWNARERFWCAAATSQRPASDDGFSAAQCATVCFGRKRRGPTRTLNDIQTSVLNSRRRLLLARTNTSRLYRKKKNWLKHLISSSAPIVTRGHRRSYLILGTLFQ